MTDSELKFSRGCKEGEKDKPFPLLSLPVDVLVQILSMLDAKSMASTELVTRAFRSRHPGSGLRLVEQAARDAYERQFGPRERHSFRYFLHCVFHIASN